MVGIEPLDVGAADALVDTIGVELTPEEMQQLRLFFATHRAIATNAALGLAARIVEGSTSWGLSPTQKSAVERFKTFAAYAIRAHGVGATEEIPS